MKTVTINVSESVFAEFKSAAQSSGRPTSELIREAMELYRSARLQPVGNLSSFSPRSVGKVLRPLTAGNSLQDEAGLDEIRCV